MNPILDSLAADPMVIVPGINDSGPEHWQSLWQQAHPDARRIAPASFDDPDLDDWVEALRVAVEDCATPPLLVAHSLGTLTVLEWAARDGGHRARAVILVAVPDPAGPDFPAQAPSFTHPRPASLGAPAVVVASSDDPYDPDGYAAEVARLIGAGLQLIGPCGHINAASGLGDWPAGQQFLTDLL